MAIPSSRAVRASCWKRLPQASNSGDCMAPACQKQPAAAFPSKRSGGIDALLPHCTCEEIVWRQKGVHVPPGNATYTRGHYTKDTVANRREIMAMYQSVRRGGLEMAEIYGIESNILRCSKLQDYYVISLLLPIMRR